MSVLDAGIQYLRYVHLFCYFSSGHFKDIGELIQRAATPFVRQREGAVASNRLTQENQDSALSDPKRFYENVDLFAEKTISKALDAYRSEQEKLDEVMTRRKELAGTGLDAFLKSSFKVIQTENGPQYQCALPHPKPKNFQNEIFVCKHLANFHAHDGRAAQRAALYNLFLDNFQADDDKPLSRLPRFAEDILRGEYQIPADRFSSKEADLRNREITDDQIAKQRRYRDPDAPEQGSERPRKPKLKYRTRVSYEASL